MLKSGFQNRSGCKGVLRGSERLRVSSQGLMEKDDHVRGTSQDGFRESIQGLRESRGSSQGLREVRGSSQGLRESEGPVKV